MFTLAPCLFVFISSSSVCVVCVFFLSVYCNYYWELFIIYDTFIYYHNSYLTINVNVSLHVMMATTNVDCDGKILTFINFPLVPYCFDYSTKLYTTILSLITFSIVVYSHVQNKTWRHWSNRLSSHWWQYKHGKLLILIIGQFPFVSTK